MSHKCECLNITQNAAKSSQPCWGSQAPQPTVATSRMRAEQGVVGDDCTSGWNTVETAPENTKSSMCNLSTPVREMNSYFFSPHCMVVVKFFIITSKQGVVMPHSTRHAPKHLRLLLSQQAKNHLVLQLGF